MRRKEMEIYLDRLEAVKTFLESHPLGELHEEMVKIDNSLKRFKSLSELLNHMEAIESVAYTVKEYLTIQEASQYLGVSKSMLYKLTSSKEISVYKPTNKTVYIHRDELFKWITKNRVLSEEELAKEANLKAFQIEKELKRKKHERRHRLQLGKGTN